MTHKFLKLTVKPCLNYKSEESFVTFKDLSVNFGNNMSFLRLFIK